MRRGLRRTLLVATVLTVTGGIVSLAVIGSSYSRAASLVVRAAGLGGRYPRIASWYRQAVSESPLTIPSRHGPIAARLYRPTGGYPAAVLLVPGINALGVEEPRLSAFARAISETGLLVVTAAMPDMTRYLVTARTTDTIEDAALWMAARRDLAPGGRIGMAGISFAGGLSIVAAGRPALRDRVTFVFAFGPHASFPQVLRFFCTGIVPLPPWAPERNLRPGVRRVEGGVWRKPHDYGAAVVALDLADRLVPPEQLAPLRRAILEFLAASHIWINDPEAAEARFETARRLGRELPEPASAIMREVNDRDVEALGARLLPLLGGAVQASSLSPIESPAPRAPVYILHGIDDNLVPPEETLLLEHYLAGKTRTRVLMTDLMDHAELGHQPTLSEAWTIVSLIAGMLRE
ncbi:MAG: hypothetical protein ACE148_10285 [Vicinamibacterales bacterium]